MHKICNQDQSIECMYKMYVHVHDVVSHYLGHQSMADVRRLYFKLQQEVLQQRPRSRCSPALDNFLRAHLGTEMKMNSVRRPKSVKFTPL